VLGKSLVGEIFGMQLMCCRLKGQDAMTKFMIVLNSAMDGQDTDRFPFSFFDRHGKYVEALLTANKRTDAEGSITGVFCFLHTASPELLQVSFLPYRITLYFSPFEIDLQVLKFSNSTAMLQSTHVAPSYFLKVCFYTSTAVVGLGCGPTTPMTFLVVYTELLL